MNFGFANFAMNKIHCENEMESFEELKAVCHAACHQRNACKDGFAAMLMAENTADLMHVWRRWWQDIYVSKYADIMTAKIATATGRLRREMRQSDVFVNEPTERGLLIVCQPDRTIKVGGTAKCYVFGGGLVEGAGVRIEATDHAQVFCRTKGVRITLRGHATAKVEAGDCEIYDRSFLKGKPDSIEIHDQAVFEEILDM